MPLCQSPQRPSTVALAAVATVSATVFRTVVFMKVRLGAAHWYTNIVHLRRDARQGGTCPDQALDRGYEEAVGIAAKVSIVTFPDTEHEFGNARGGHTCA